MMGFMEAMCYTGSATDLQSISTVVLQSQPGHIKPLLRMTSSCNLYDLCMFDVPLSTYVLQGGAVRHYVSLPCL